MGLMLLKKFGLLLFLFSSGSLVLSCFAGRRSKLINNMAAKVNSFQEEVTPSKLLNKEEVTTVHERLLRVNGRDYGSYDPPPLLSKPPFKLMPN